MNILWILNKHFDIALDKTSWVGLSERLFKMGHNSFVLSGYKQNKIIKLQYVKLLPSIRIPILHYLSLNITILIVSFVLIIKKRFDYIICCYMSGITGALLKSFTVGLGLKQNIFLK